jgi:hypothetical protein
MAISNGIFLGEFPVLQFYGSFEWKEKARKLEFDFDTISVLGLKITLPKGTDLTSLFHARHNCTLIKLPPGGAAKIGQSTGLGSESNIELVEKGRKPFFNWISADAEIATARGGGNNY